LRLFCDDGDEDWDEDFRIEIRLVVVCDHGDDGCDEDFRIDLFLVAVCDDGDEDWDDGDEDSGFRDFSNPESSSPSSQNPWICDDGDEDCDEDFRIVLFLVAFCDDGDEEWDEDSGSRNSGKIPGRILRRRGRGMGRGFRIQEFR